MPKTRKNQTPETETTETPQKQILTARDVAAVLDLSVCRVHQMLAAGELPSVRVGSKGGGVRIPRQAFDAYLAALNASACAKLNLETFAAAFQASGSALADILTPSAEAIARTEHDRRAFMQGIENACPPLPHPR